MFDYWPNYETMEQMICSLSTLFSSNSKTYGLVSSFYGAQGKGEFNS